MKSSHFERSEVRRRDSSTFSLLTETFYGERTQDGDCRVDISITMRYVGPRGGSPGTWASTAARCESTSGRRVPAQNQPFRPPGRMGQNQPLTPRRRVGRRLMTVVPILRPRRRFKTSHFARRVRGRNRRLCRRRGAQAAAASPVLAAKRGRPSECEPFQSLILEKLQQELSAQRIYQDLGRARLHGQLRQREAVRAALGRSAPLPMRRMECAPGEEAQVDFGSGAPVIGPDGKRRKTHVFRIVLSHSRKAYSEATFRQTTEDFIGCLENAFAHFGGVPKILVIDNLRAAVKHPDWFDPELVPKLRSFCQHYGVVILPTKPYMPRHKGKVEARREVRAEATP